MPLITGLPPLIPTTPQILILGSFPSVESLKRQEYYASRSNRFWKLIGVTLSGTDLTDCPYKQKTALLEQYGFALWDVIAACERSGSSDSQIRNPEWTDLSGLLHTHQSIKKIILNGSTATHLFLKASASRLLKESSALPFVGCLSTSAANQKYGPWDKLIANWMPHLHP